MLRRRESTQRDEQLDAAIEFAWNAHHAQEAWTGRLDNKAAIFLVLQSAILSAMLAGQLGGRLLSNLDQPRLGIAIAGMAFSVIGALFAVMATIPMLGGRKELRSTHRDHLIYFGHLRHWKSEKLGSRLAELSHRDQIDQLARQLVAMSKRNWRKHVFLQIAMSLGLSGAALVGGALLFH